MCCILFIYVVQIINMCCTGYFHMLCKISHILSKKFICLRNSYMLSNILSYVV